MLLVTSNIIFAQVGIGTTTPNASAVLDLSSTTGGLLMPRMTDLQRMDIVSPVAGLQVFDTTTNTIWYNNGTAWVNSGAATGNTLYTGNGALTFDRTVDMGSNTLTFTGTKQFRINGFAGSQSFSMGGSGVFGIDAPSIVNGRFVVLDNGNVGIGTNSPVGKLDVAGNIVFNGATSSGILRANNAATLNILSGTGSINFDNNVGDTNLMTILNSGNVGIGTASPGYALDVVGRSRFQSPIGDTAGFWLTNQANNADRAFIGMESDDVVGIFGATAGNFGLVMNTNTNNVGIGTINPAGKLDVAGNIVFNGTTTSGVLRANDATTLNILSGTGSINFDNNVGDTNLMTILNSGNVGIGTNSPAGKLDVAGTLAINGNTGTAGQLLISQGSTNSPVWSNPVTDTAYSDFRPAPVNSVPDALTMRAQITDPVPGKYLVNFSVQCRDQTTLFGAYTLFLGIKAGSLITPSSIEIDGIDEVATNNLWLSYSGTLILTVFNPGDDIIFYTRKASFFGNTDIKLVSLTAVKIN